MQSRARKQLEVCFEAWGTHSIVRLNERIVDGDDLDVSVLDTGHVISVSYGNGGSNVRGTYALRKTILPIRPKPLIPTSVSDMIAVDQVDEVWVKICRGCVGVLKKLRENNGGGSHFISLTLKLKALSSARQAVVGSGRWRSSDIRYHTIASTSHNISTLRSTHQGMRIVFSDSLYPIFHLSSCSCI